MPTGIYNRENITPLSRGGTNEFNNLGISCNKCNNKKGKKTVEEYLLKGEKNQ